MINQLFPQIYIENVLLLPINNLEKRGIKAIFFDIDNTVAPFDEEEATEEILEFLNNLIKRGFKICLFSNNNQVRVEKFNEKIKVLAIHKAGKPGTKKLAKAMKELNVTANEVAVVGDQVFTDVYCANRLGAVSVLTVPMCERDQFITKIKRGMEREVLKIYKRSLQNGHRN